MKKIFIYLAVVIFTMYNINNNISLIVKPEKSSAFGITDFKAFITLLQKPASLYALLLGNKQYIVRERILSTQQNIFPNCCSDIMLKPFRLNQPFSKSIF